MTLIIRNQQYEISKTNFQKEEILPSVIYHIIDHVLAPLAVDPSGTIHLARMGDCSEVAELKGEC
ncbi:hypothetical protein N7451_003368 [Penicillium sp. IBT 35674x]|nr:hypothetical protein N7451_003368 [Penicillium sp. IBT 35674x]